MIPPSLPLEPSQHSYCTISHSIPDIPSIPKQRKEEVGGKEFGEVSTFLAVQVDRRVSNHSYTSH